MVQSLIRKTSPYSLCLSQCLADSIVKKYVLNEGLDIKRDIRETTVGVRVTGKEE